MAMPNERLWDDSGFVPAGMPRPAPQSLGQLLANLHLTTADDATRRRGIHRWLISNTPSDRLVRSIRRRGYGDLLSQPAD